MDRKELGSLGERTAAAWYQNNGYRVVQMNYRQRFGEIDIVAEGKGCIIFSEVKLRAENSLVRPCEAVTYSKQKKIIMTAQMWLLQHRTVLQPRFDVAEVIHRNGEILSCQVIENAFGA